MSLRAEQKHKKVLAGGGIAGYFRQHAHAISMSFRQCLRAPVASFFTMCLLGVALALPLGVWLVLQNVETLTHRWDQQTHISLFLKQSVSEADAQTFATTLRQQTGIAAVTYISPAQGLTEMQQALGVHDLLSALNQNPLPAVLEIHPSISFQSPLDLDALTHRLAAYPEVASTRFDMAWVQRLDSALALGEQMLILLVILLGMGILFSVGNTIRVTALYAQAEVKVIQLIGGSSAFTRRPFLYTGLWYGIGGAALACWWIQLGVNALRPSVHQLAQLYGSDYALMGLNSDVMSTVFTIGAALGILGAFLAVSHPLRKVRL